MPERLGNKASSFARVARRLSEEGAPALIGMTDPQRLPDPENALTALPSGSLLIWRAYDQNPDRREVRRIARLAETRNCLLLLAGQPRLAEHTHGIHLSERFIIDPFTDGYLMDLHRQRPGFIVTAAAHSEPAIRRAARAGADAVLISPVFATQSHPGTAHLGTVRTASFAHKASALGLAAYALGGIATENHAQRLNGTGVIGIAGIGFLQS